MGAWTAVSVSCWRASASSERRWRPAVVAGSGKVYRFPDKSYGNVEGIAWLSPDTLVAVSDQKTKAQRARCAEKDQSIHVFRIPAD